MLLKKATQKQIEQLFYNHFAQDFPKNERIPLSLWLLAEDSGFFDTQILTKEDRPLGYTTLAKYDSVVLIYYLSIFKEYRNYGYGSDFLSKIWELCSSEKAIYVEVDRPGFGKTDAENRIRQRRISFYHRNHFLDTDVQFKLFGADLELMVYPTNPEHIVPSDSVLLKTEQQILRSLFGTSYMEAHPLKLTF